MKYYHATKPENVVGILTHGLRPPKGHSIVYLSEKPSSWKQAGDALLSVSVDDPSAFPLTRPDKDVDEVCCWNQIPPWCIEIEEWPCSQWGKLDQDVKIALLKANAMRMKERLGGVWPKPKAAKSKRKPCIYALVKSVYDSHSDSTEVTTVSLFKSWKSAIGEMHRAYEKEVHDKKEHFVSGTGTTVPIGYAMARFSYDSPPLEDQEIRWEIRKADTGGIQ